MPSAHDVEALLHARAQMLLNPGVGGFQSVVFEESAYLGFDACGVAGESQKVVAGEFDKEFAVDSSPEGENPFSDVECQDGVSYPGFGSGAGILIG